MKLHWINASFPVQFFNKMFIVFRENCRFLKMFLSIYLEMFTHLFQSFTNYFSHVIP